MICQKSANFNRHSPKWPAALRQDRMNLPAEQAFLPREVSAVAVSPEVGRNKPRTRIIPARQSRFSARRTDLSSRFRSLWVRIADTHIAVALERGGWRQGPRAASHRRRPPRPTGFHTITPPRTRTLWVIHEKTPPITINKMIHMGNTTAMTAKSVDYLGNAG